MSGNTKEGKCPKAASGLKLRQRPMRGDNYDGRLSGNYDGR